MEALEATMNKQNIDLDSSSSNSSYHGHALSAYVFSFNATTLLLLLVSGLLILEHLIIWLRIKPFFRLLMKVTPNKYLLVMIELLVL
jgi:hypothetical protein